MWKAFAVVTLVFAGGVWLYTHYSRANAEAEREERRRISKEEREQERKPHEVELYGMSITTPGLGTESGDYEHGSYLGIAPVEFGVQWMPSGSVTRLAVIGAVTSSYNKTYNWNLKPVSDRSLTVGSLAAHENVLESGNSVVIATQLECGKRQVMLLVAGADADLHQINDRMVASFKCTPDPEKDVSKPPVAVDAVKGWKRDLHDKGRVLALTGPHGEILRTAKLGPRDGSVADQITSLVDGTAIRLIGKPTTRNDKVFWQGINAADQKPAAVLAWRCDDDRVAFITIIADKSVDEAVAVADTGRCLKDEDPLPIY